MKKLSLLLLMLLCSVGTMWAETTTMTLKPSLGTLYKNGSTTGQTWNNLWVSTATPTIKISVGANNMGKSNDRFEMRGGQTYTIMVDDDNYCIDSYTMTYSSTNGSYPITITYNSTETVTSPSNTTDTQTLTVSDVNAVSVALSLNQSANYGIYATLEVTLKEAVVDELQTFVALPTKTTSDVPYRIPAIGQAKNGDVIAVADYRYSRADIGMATNGKIDLKYRIKDHSTGKWGEIKTLAAAEGTDAMGKYATAKEDSLHFAYGDPCIVCDINSSEVVVTSCSGNISFPNGTRTNHQGWAYFRSHDNGQTWDDVKDISDQIFTQFDARTADPIKCMFIGSGKICQSTTVKIGTYNRLYCAGLVKLNSGNTAWTIYSDDLGETWKVLGGVQNIPITGADEPKSEELPDGSVLLSSRVGSGRYYNIYHFTDMATGAGYWESQATVSNSVTNYQASSNACNGETLCVPVTRKSDSAKTWLLLQSVPFGPTTRANVGINYKELTDFNDFRTPAMLQTAWDGNYQVSTLGSAYSTMCQGQDGTVHFLYEEETYCGSSGGGYSIVYKDIPVSTLTSDAYEYRTPTKADSVAYLTTGFPAYYTTVANEVGSNVGQIAATQKTALDAVEATYMATPSYANYCAYNAAYKSSLTTAIAGTLYKIQYSNPTGYVFTSDGDKVLYAAQSDTNLKWGVAPSDGISYYWYVTPQTDGKYAIRNLATGKYIGTGGSTSGTVAMSTTAYSAISMNGSQGEFKLTSSGGQPFHCGGHSSGAGTGGNIVGWSNGWNTWNIIPVAEADAQTLQNSAYDAMYAITNTLTYDTYDCVGAPSKTAADALSALNVARGESEDITIAKLQALQDAYYVYMASIKQPEAGCYYRLRNTNRNSGNNYAYTCGTGLKTGTKGTEDVSIIRFDDAKSGNFYLRTNDGKMVQAFTAVYAMIATDTLHVPYAVASSGVGKFNFGATTTTSGNRFLHDDNNGKVVGWTQTAEASIWKLEEVSADDIWTVSLTQPENADPVSLTYGATGYTGIANALNGGFYKIASTPATTDFTSGLQYYDATVTVDETTKTISATFTLQTSAFDALKAQAKTYLEEKNGVGYRSVAAHDALQEAYDDALEVETPTAADVQALNAAVNTYKNSAIQMPESGHYYTIQGKVSGNYITSTNNSSSRAQMSSTFDSTGIFLYDGTHLTSYATGYRLGNATWGMTTEADVDRIIAFEAGVNFGYITIKCTNSGQSATMYDSGTYVNRQGSKDSGGHTDWYFTEITGSLVQSPTVIGAISTTDKVTSNISEYATSVTLTNATISTVSIEDIQTAVVEKTGNHNTIIYAPSGTTVQSTTANVVVDGTCQKLNLTDGEEFAIPTEFTATEATYTRSMTNNYGTICLPYAVEASGNTMYYTIGGVSNSMLTLTEASSLEAGTPALVYTSTAGDVTSSAFSQTITGSISSPITNDTKNSLTLIMHGCYTDTKVTDENAYYIKNNKFWKRAEQTREITDPYFTIAPFRAYFTIKSTESARELASVLGIEGEEDGTETAINALMGNGDVTIADIYDATGKKLPQLMKGLNIVKLSNGKSTKIMVK